MHLFLAAACVVLGAVTAQTQVRAPRPGISVQVTDGTGNALPGVTVKLTGPIAREGKTDQAGTINFANLRAGAFRLRFEHEGFVTLERDVTVRTTPGAPIEVMLTPAPPPPKPEPIPAPPVPVKPAAQRTTERPRLVSVPNFVEDNLIARTEGKKESNLACMGTATATLIQLRDPLPEHANAESDEMIYVVAGEATIKLNGREDVLEAASFITIPVGTSYSLTRRGRNPVTLLSIVSGQPCRGVESTASSNPPH